MIERNATRGEAKGKKKEIVSLSAKVQTAAVHSLACLFVACVVSAAPFSCLLGRDSLASDNLDLGRPIIGEDVAGSSLMQLGHFKRTADGQASPSEIVPGHCEKKHHLEAHVVSDSMSNASHHVVLFAWEGCECATIAEERLKAETICYESYTWDDGNSPLMTYLQCKENTKDHSFVYIKHGSTWMHFGSGRKLSTQETSHMVLNEILYEANASKGCEEPSIAAHYDGELIG